MSWSRLVVVLGLAITGFSVSSATHSQEQSAAGAAAAAPPSSDRVNSGAVTIESTVPESPLTVGDRADWWVTITAPGEAAVGVPSVAAASDAIEVVEPFALIAEEKSEDSVVRRFRARLAAFATGVAVAPAAEVLIRDADNEQRVALPTVGFPVRSVLPAGTPPPIRGAKGLLAIPTWLSPWMLVLAVLTLVALGYLYWSRRRDRTEVAAIVEPPALPYDQWALKELEALLRSPLVGAGRHKEFFVRFSEILRIYLSRRYQFDALEMTSGELRTLLKERGVEGDGRALVWSLLELGDLAKFARFAPANEDRDEAVRRARGLYESSTVAAPKAVAVGLDGDL